MNDRIKTTPISYRELRPCASCGGALGIIFHEVTTKLCVVNRGAVGRTLSLASYFGSGRPTGAGFALAQAMGPDGDKAADRSEDPATTDRIFLCNDCFHGVRLKPGETRALGLIVAASREKEERDGEQARANDSLRA